MLKKVWGFIIRRINRIYESKKFYKENNKKLIKMLDKSKKNIWFIGSAHYNNIGDLAISEATKEFLNDNYLPKYNIIDIRLCDYFKYEKALKKNIKKNDIIIMQGRRKYGI